MSDEHSNRLLTTGELAQACGITVRAIQYYDEKGLLSPTQRSDGGRRLYDEASVERLRTICLLKSLGLSLKAIRGVMESDGSPEVLSCLLQEQEKELVSKTASDQAMLDAVRAERARISRAEGHEPNGAAADEGETSATTTRPGMGHVMGELIPMAEQGTRLRRTQRKMLLEGSVLSAVEIVCVVGGFMTGNWWPLLAALPLIVIITAELVWMYHRDARYVCPHCHATFQPGMREFFFATHTPKTRKLTCTHCHTKDWCIEIASERAEESATH